MKHHTHYARTKPNAPAIIMAGSGKTITWREYSKRVNRLAQYFRAIGLKEKDHISIYLENNEYYLQIMDAAMDAGLVFTTLSTQLKREETEYVITNSESKMFIASDTYADLAAEIADNVPQVTHRLMLGTAIDGYDPFEETIARYDDVPIPYNKAGRPLYYSSGTTGRPKGVSWDVEDFPVGTIDPSLAGMLALSGVNEDMVYLSTQPLYHAAPSMFALVGLQVGGTIVVMDKFDAEKALSFIEQYGITHTQWVPTMFVRMLKLPADIRAQYDTSSLKLAIHSAAPCPVAVKEKMIEWWGPILIEYWGGTETGLVTLITSEEWLKKKGSVGKAYTAKLHIMDDDGNQLPPHEPGLIYMESGRPFSYLKDPEKTASTRNEKGWVDIGDIGYLDEEGYLYLTDRKSFMIITGGVNVYPQETEDVLIMHPMVADVAVIGVPNEEFGEEVKAVVQPVDMAEAGPALEAALIAFCRERISHIKCPKSIDFMAEFPRTATGKLLKRVIKEKYQ